MDPSTTIEQLTEPYLLSFYGWWQLVVCLFGFLALMAIWWHIGRKQNDFGQVWLALSVLCWSVSGGIELYFSYHLQEEGQYLFEQLQNLSPADERPTPTLEELQDLGRRFLSIRERDAADNFLLDGWRSILSLFNSLFILLALPWFRYLPRRIESVVQSRYWPYIVGLPFLFSLLPTLSKMFFGKAPTAVSELDVYYATLTLAFLGLVLWESFAKRRLRFLAWLSLACICITFVAQLYKLTDRSIDLTLFSAIFKTTLIMIFFALALSWVKELAENVIPDARQLFLQFRVQKTEQGRLTHLVQVRGFPGNQERRIVFTPTTFDLFLTFAKKRVGEEDDWLEIKPKGESRTRKEYDINDYNEIKRLLATLLDGIFGKDNWARNQHLIPLKDQLFELSSKRERKIRLSVPPENISLP
ncbi:MAG: hypothetical protein R2824_35225 [Saprospiraceae bacterium]|nr:hypothetical protein [Lewinella sp.]